MMVEAGAGTWNLGITHFEQGIFIFIFAQIFAMIFQN